MSEPHFETSKRTLSAFDAACIIVGIIIGAGIYRTTPMIAGFTADPYWLIGVWVLGGCLALIGALCYVELA
ncbi:MAG: amino acid permease, partial [Planctomycetota bacterium]|nr:amino acid permease [Planctomycetota bacterium]